MWFKNLLIYRLTQPLEFTQEALETALQTKPAKLPESQVLSTVGFMSPTSKAPDAPLVHQVQNIFLVALRTYERILPGSVVKDAVTEKVDEIEADQLRKVYKKERDQIKDEIIQSFLPRAFIRKATTFAALDFANNVIYVNTSSAGAAENLLSTLREVLGTLPVRPVTVKIAPTATFTDWVRTAKAADDFYVLDNCKLSDTHEDGGEIMVKKQDLTGDDIKNLVASGKVVTQLSLAYKDKMSFSITDKLGLQRIRFEDLLQEQAVQDGGEDASGQFDASLLLLTSTLGEMLPSLLSALGGEETPQGI